MPHPLVSQLRFARSEFVRCLEGVSDEDARHRIMPKNSTILCFSPRVKYLTPN
jgi:hypothetical protein